MPMQDLQKIAIDEEPMHYLIKSVLPLKLLPGFVPIAVL